MSTVSRAGAAQIGLPGMCAIEKAVASLAVAGNEERGAVFTKREVADFILDLVAYRTDRPLHGLRFLEPSFGAGDFLLLAIERLLISWRRHAPGADPLSLLPCIRGVELHEASFEATKTRVLKVLTENGVDVASAQTLAATWLIQGDFLLAPLDQQFDVVVGNPPYVRQELIPEVLLAAYRARYKTLFDRADLYVPFIERSLLALAPKGLLSFICSDRWMKNRYGGPLRELIAKRFHLKAYIDMVNTPAFHEEVTAYPAIVLIEQGGSGPTRVVERPEVEVQFLKQISQAILADATPPAESSVRELSFVASGSEPWMLAASKDIDLIRRLESKYPTLEDAGCKVGIGVATGADQAFIGVFDDLDVEADRKLPLVMTKDIASGSVHWRGFGVINPFADRGGLVNLENYPRLEAYLTARKEEISGRHVAQKNRENWYRTIDRIYPELAKRPKLLIPDIKGGAHVVYEDGRLYPHHNLYYVVSDTWDLRALQAVLLSNITQLFITSYSTAMRGGYLRFQAQYLRRIRIPHWDSVSLELRAALGSAAERLDIAECNSATATLYDLSEEERSLMFSYGS